MYVCVTVCNISVILSCTVQQPLQGWVTEATTHVKGLFPLEIDREKLNESKERLERIQEEANGEKPRVDRMIDLTAAFEDSREVRVCQISSINQFGQVSSANSLPLSQLSKKVFLTDLN